MEPIVIGISGATNGGKTTLCDKLCDVYPGCKVMCMDDFYWGDEHENHIHLPQFDGYANWEVETSVDFVTMVNEVRSWKEKVVNGEIKTPILLVEGIMIFNNKELSSEFNKKYFLTLDKEVCWRRRKSRLYEPPEPEGYYDAICWPEYVRNKNELKDQNDIVYIDGTDPQSDTFAVVHQHVEALLTVNTTS